MRPRARLRPTPRPLRVPPTTTAGMQATGGEVVRFSAYTGSGAWRRHSNPGASCLSLAGRCDSCDVLPAAARVWIGAALVVGDPCRVVFRGDRNGRILPTGYSELRGARYGLKS